MSKANKLTVPAPPSKAAKKAALRLPRLPIAAATPKLNSLVVPRPPLPQKRR